MPNPTTAEYETLFPFISTFHEIEDAEEFIYKTDIVHTLELYLTSIGLLFEFDDRSDEQRKTYKLIARTVSKELYLSEDFQNFLIPTIVPIMGNVYDIVLKDALYSTSFYLDEIGFGKESNFTDIFDGSDSPDDPDPDDPDPTDPDPDPESRPPTQTGGASRS